MLSNYPEGSMRGSGIYATERDEELTCQSELLNEAGDVIGTCDFDGTVTAYVDDWGKAQLECPKCGSTTTREREEY
jgi:hypothetical protein